MPGRVGQLEISDDRPNLAHGQGLLPIVGESPVLWPSDPGRLGSVPHDCGCAAGRWLTKVSLLSSSSRLRAN